MNFTWSKNEKVIAKKAFDLAYANKCKNIINQIQSYKFKNSQDIWELGEFIKKQEKEINQVFDYRYSQLILVFALLLKQDLIAFEDLKGLSEEKINKISEIKML